MSTSSISVVFEDDEYIEFELVQPNDLLGDTNFWTEEDKDKWDAKMLELEEKGIKGEMETIRVKFKKNPFLDGAGYMSPK